MGVYAHLSGTNPEEPPQHHHSTTTTQHTSPFNSTNVSKLHYTSIIYNISSQLPIMLPVNQLCSWLPIMLLAINYAQNYASIIGKGLPSDPGRGCLYRVYWSDHPLYRHSPCLLPVLVSTYYSYSRLST